MRPSRRRGLDAASLLGAPLAVAVIVAAQWLEGSGLRTLLQPTAALIVFGGTFAALLVSFPLETLWRAAAGVGWAFSPTPAPSRALVAQFAQYAVRARRKGVLALEDEIARADDPFLARALTLAIDGFSAVEVKQALEIDSRTREAADEESAEVLEAAAGYAPTLGILGAVLGLIHVMEHLSAPSTLGGGIAVAFVATVYGVGSANLVLLPLATKMRAGARSSALTREVIIVGIGAIQASVHPRLVEQQLTAYVAARDVTEQAA